MTNPTLKAIDYRDGKLNILDQLLLPGETKYISINEVKDGWNAIHKMQVRGAPAIAVVGCLSLVVELQKENISNKEALSQFAKEKLNYLVTARPTAVNMKTAAQELVLFVDQLSGDKNVSSLDMKSRLITKIENMLEKDISDNKAIGEFGAKLIVSQAPDGCEINILTHCNTGSLATAGYGTALGVVRSLYSMKRLDHVYCTETRPYNQGARLTAYELVYERMPATLITDSMVAALMKTKRITAVVVGADRVASNGDTANKIGTYQIAILCKHHKVPFYVAAPFTSIDFNMQDGNGIVIEERPEKELTHVGEHRIAAPGISCWNPAFDVTPAELISGIITEKGVYHPNELVKQRLL